MRQLPVHDIDYIYSLEEPCYDPLAYVPEGWKGNALDVLAVDKAPTIDRMWVLTLDCSDWLPDEVITGLACWILEDIISTLPYDYETNGIHMYLADQTDENFQLMDDDYMEFVRKQSDKSGSRVTHYLGAVGLAKSIVSWITKDMDARGMIWHIIEDWYKLVTHYATGYQNDRSYWEVGVETRRLLNLWLQEGADE